ncbi:HI1506-related protein [Thaumasiovibrio subtropicus]|uniref:HI1506-related protein n=1 Tax=Thaumasiovibrio subtropicus TaxID=1891207 RepID=UPI000B34DB48|nr:HI1506-related protein [Thaumasiovibrio subtropicus]
MSISETPLSPTSQSLVIYSHAPNGYRRAGMVFKFGKNTLEVGALNATQLAQLKADPRLAVLAAPLVNAVPAQATQTDNHRPSSGALDAQASQGDIAAQASQSEVAEGNLKGLEGSKIETAITQLDPNNPNHFTNSGKPQTDILSQLVGRRVSAAERDQAWESYQS